MQRKSYIELVISLRTVAIHPSGPGDFETLMLPMNSLQSNINSIDGRDGSTEWS